MRHQIQRTGLRPGKSHWIYRFGAKAAGERAGPSLGPKRQGPFWGP